MIEDEKENSSSSVDLDSPRWDQSTYIGRAKHFFTATNPLNVFATSAELQKAKDIVEQHKKVNISIAILDYNNVTFMVFRA